MRADDPRHGTTAGYQAHRRANVPVCQPCLRAKSRYEKARHMYGEQMVPALGTRRRIQALKALGFSGAEIGEHLGTTYQAVHKLETNTAAKVFAPTARNVADLYVRLVATSPIGPHRVRIRNQAAARGYALPHQWHDLDDPDEQPDPGYRDRSNFEHAARGDLDPVVVDRILAGDFDLARATSRAEKVAVVARWRADGRPLRQLELATGWKTNIYVEREAS